MFLKKLKLTNFRNYIDFDQGFNHLKTIIIGQNAQGKSNILEAINILATSQSDRAEKDSNLILWNKDYALIFADVEAKEHKLEIALQINSTGRRKLKINGISKKAPQADLFFSGELDSNKALDFLKKEKISYIFFGPQEMEKNKKDLLIYDFLKPVYKSKFVIIFEVIK